VRGEHVTPASVLPPGHAVRGHAKRPPPLRDGGAGAAASPDLPQCGSESTGGRGCRGVCAASQRPPGVDLRSTLRAAAWRTLGCVVPAALIVGPPLRDLDQFGYTLFPSHR